MCFHETELFNLALLAKQAWCLLTEPGTLIARILKVVYFSNVVFLDAQVGTSPYRVWHAIMDGKNNMEQGIIRCIGTGESTSIWHMNWLPRDGLFRPINHSWEAQDLSHVSDLIDHTTCSWRTDTLEEASTPMEKEVILSIPLCSRQQADFWAWHYEKYGIFSVCSVYHILVHNFYKRSTWLMRRKG
jgi:hypothetical protein